ncbi:MAG: GH92 family glycosyl hydrolase [Mariniphaga sp.]
MNINQTIGNEECSLPAGGSMIENGKKYSLLILCLLSNCVQLFAQDSRVLEFVDPLIGTTKTKINSQWGDEGGTFPGAVAPFGFVQLTPETRIVNAKGYDYRDTTIFFFSCVNHMSGYPEGSSGRIKVMPLIQNGNHQNGNYGRAYSHHDEKAEAGYYRVKFRDNETLVEATSSERTGMFRFTFLPQQKPKLFLGDIGKIESISKRVLRGSVFNAIFSFNIDYIDMEEVKGGWILTFPNIENGKNVLVLKIGTSMVDLKSAQLNLQTEAETWDFDVFKAKNQQKWVDALSKIEVEDSSNINKTIFYTALYHSMLIPWITSDVDGKYKGADGLTHQAKGKNQYGAFSAWDTFRTLHPLLCLIAPDRQNDMILSMLAQYEQTGKLPKGPMTGNHILAIITDSYLKGIRGFDSTLAYKAMNKSLSSTTGDFSAYKELGYVPSSYPESVTRTVEYAYDDWVLAQFAGKVMNDQTGNKKFTNRSFNYRNLFHTESLFLLPRKGDNFTLEPGNSGYKEGDKWSYSLFVPHNPRDLINFKGGDYEFAAHLDSALTRQQIFFDNEPVFHVPYLFNYANRSDQTQKWVRRIMKSHYTATPDGIPGNDDLGSMSSWYVFSAMGFFPFCPGRPEYDLGSPIFKKVTLHLQNGKKWIINANNNGEDQIFVRSASLNGHNLNTSWISHSILTDGGTLTFEMDKTPASTAHKLSVDGAFSETNKTPDFRITDFYPSRKQVLPDELFFVHFSIINKGATGTKIVKIYLDGIEYNRKNILIDENSTINDSIGCRLYRFGKRSVRIDNLKDKMMEVVTPVSNQKSAIEAVELKCRAISKTNEPLKFTFLVQNKGGIRDTATLSVDVNDTTNQRVQVALEPGETRNINSQVVFKNSGFNKLHVGSKSRSIKTYSVNSDAELGETDITPDSDNLEQKITIMAWVKPVGQSRELMDILSKGDFIVLQAQGNKALSFFAGGWGRGDLTVPLPKNWADNWHHIAGVSDGNTLKIFIDGIESGSRMINAPVNLSSPAKWRKGGNEEFPDQRIFRGDIEHFKIFVEPLTGQEINQIMMSSRPKNGA